MFTRIATPRQQVNERVVQSWMQRPSLGRGGAAKGQAPSPVASIETSADSASQLLQPYSVPSYGLPPSFRVHLCSQACVSLTLHLGCSLLLTLAHHSRCHRRMKEGA